jgi:hypothetical protein
MILLQTVQYNIGEESEAEVTGDMHRQSYGMHMKKM